jgi:hypothetical protein
LTQFIEGLFPEPVDVADRSRLKPFVSALGRSALETMACGCAVALAGPRGFGGLVAPESFQRQRTGNFGLSLLVGQPAIPQRVAESLDRYDATEVSCVTDLVHAEAGIETALDRWEEQYRLAIAEGAAPLAQIVADASAYLVKLKALTFHFERDYARLSGEFSDLGAELAATKSEREAALTRLADVESHNAALSSWAAELHTKLTRLKVPFRKRLGRKIRDAVTPKSSPR